MGKQALKYAFGATVAYLVIANGTKSGRVITDGANGVSKVWKTAQGR
jgi:hypothetical protein